MAPFEAVVICTSIIRMKRWMLGKSLSKTIQWAQMAKGGSRDDENQVKFFTTAIRNPSVAFESQRHVLLLGLSDLSGPSLS